MAVNWGRMGKTAFSLARRYGPTLASQVRKQIDNRQNQGHGAETGSFQHGQEFGGRPVASTTVPTSSRARHIDYCPDLDGNADPGEIVWTWVAYEENDGRGKDRPVIVVGRDGSTLLGLMLSSQDKRANDPDWVSVGTGTWDGEGRESWARLDRVLNVPEAGIRREGAIVRRESFDKVAARLRKDYGWS